MCDFPTPQSAWTTYTFARVWHHPFDFYRKSLQKGWCLGVLFKVVLRFYCGSSLQLQRPCKWTAKLGDYLRAWKGCKRFLCEREINNACMKDINPCIFLLFISSRCILPSPHVARWFFSFVNYLSICAKSLVAVIVVQWAALIHLSFLLSPRRIVQFVC